MKKQNKLADQNKQFQNKFEGRSNQISRQGLLYLLNHKRQQLEKSNSKNKPINQRYDLKNIQNLQAQVLISARKKKSSKIKEDIKDFNNMAQSLENTPRFKMNSQTSELKLPKIRKAQSMTSQIRRSQKLLPNLPNEQRTAPSLQLKSKDKKISLLNKVQMSKIAESHLDFLNKFQKQLKRVSKKGKNWPIQHSNPEND